MVLAPDLVPKNCGASSNPTQISNSAAVKLGLISAFKEVNFF